MVKTVHPKETSSPADLKKLPWEALQAGLGPLGELENVDDFQGELDAEL